MRIAGGTVCLLGTAAVLSMLLVSPAAAQTPEERRRAEIDQKINRINADMQTYRARADAAMNAANQLKGQMDPAEAAMKAAKDKLDAARTAEATHSRALRAQAESDPAIPVAQKRLSEARQAHDALRSRVLASLKTDPQHIDAQLAVTTAEQDLVKARDAPDRSPEKIAHAAMVISEKQHAVAQLEDEAMKKDPGYADVRSELDAASKDYAVLEKQITDMIKDDPRRQELTKTAAAADQAYREASTAFNQIRSKFNTAKNAYNSAARQISSMQSQIESLNRQKARI